MVRGALPGPRSARKLGALTLAAAMATALSLAVEAEPADAYTQLFKKVGAKNGPPDPCSKLGVPDSGGLVVRTQPNPGKPSIPRYIALLCGPRAKFKPSVLLVDDQIWQYTLGHGGHTSTHMIRGGQKSLPWKSGLSTHIYPYIKGPNGSSPNVSQALKNDKFKNILIGLLEKAGIKDALSALLCVVGGLETGGGLCTQLLENLGITAVLAATLGADLLVDEFEMFLSRGYNMTDSNWFYWSDGVGFWNGFGDITSGWINPSINIGMPVFDPHPHGRIGVVFSNVGLVQGPNWSFPRSSARSSGDQQYDRLARVAARVSRGIRGRRLFGNGHPNRLRGSRREDHIMAGGGRDRILGRAGADMLQGGKGNDLIRGGRGADRIDGNAGNDRIFGGRGNDLIYDVFARAYIDAGPGTNYVVVRDGDSRDRVRCTRSRRNVVVADRGDIVARSCAVGRSRIVRHGPRMVIGPRSSRRAPRGAERSRARRAN